MPKKSKRAKTKQRSFQKTEQASLTASSNNTAIKKEISAVLSSNTTSKALSPMQHQYIIPDLIKIGIIAAIIFAIEIILSFIIH